MPFQHKPNSGTFFDNDRKVKDSHPDLKGSALIDGKEYWISGWINEEPGKNRRINLAFEIKQEMPIKPKQSSPIPKDDDIPF